MFYRQTGPFDEIRNSVMRGGIPFTTSIIAINVVLFLVNAFSNGIPLKFLGCGLSDGYVLPIWGLLTYPLLTPDFINLVFGCIWMWGLGGSLERSWGMKRFAGFFVLVSLAMSLSIWLGSRIVLEQHILAGLWLPLTSLTCAWAALNPRQVMRAYFVLNIEARWIALFMVGVVYFEDFQGQLSLGLFSLISPAIAYYYVRGNWGTGGIRQFVPRGPDLHMSSAKNYRVTGLDGSRRPTGVAGWWQDLQERRRLQKLLKDTRYNDRDFRDR